MSDSAIRLFRHRAMRTTFEIRLADADDPAYAAQAAQAGFDLLDRIEERMSRFVEHSDLGEIAALDAGAAAVVAEPVWSCLVIAREMESITGGAFSPTWRDGANGLDRWRLEPGGRVVCVIPPVRLDPGAIGKGFALDRIGELLRDDWQLESWLLVAGGSTVLAGAAPHAGRAWQAAAAGRNWRIERSAVSGSGTGAQGAHISDPRTGIPADLNTQTWAFCADAARADAWSTAAMVLTPGDRHRLKDRNDARLFIHSGGARFETGRFPVTPVSAPA